MLRKQDIIDVCVSDIRVGFQVSEAVNKTSVQALLWLFVFVSFAPFLYDERIF